MADYFPFARTLAMRLVDEEARGHYECDAEEWFDDPDLAEWGVWFSLNYFDIAGEDYGGVEGGITITDPAGVEHDFVVTTARNGDVDLARAWYAKA